MSSIVKKPWGEEIILTESNLPYTAKIAHTNADNRWSRQYHDQKTETLVLISGQATLTLGDQKIAMTINQGYTILPSTIHRLEALTDCTTLEVSTPETTDTTHRLEDDYHRGDETPDIRNSPNRGWHG